MTRARALAAAVPQRVYTAVAGLVLLASLGVALVLGAGLATWRGAVGHDGAQGGARPPSVVSPPRSAVIVVPTPHTRAPHVPAPPQTVQTVVVGVPAPAAAPPAPPAHPVTPTPSKAVPPAAPVASPRVAATASKHGKAAHANTAHTNRGKHLGWTKGARGNGHGNGKGLELTHG